VSRGLEAARGHLAAAATELEAAVGAWGLWADEVRERAERRLGAGPDDRRVWGDPEYARALDAGGPFVEAARAVATALQASGWMPGAGRVCGPGHPGPETAIGSPHS
jgi:hypothetical protein